MSRQSRFKVTVAFAAVYLIWGSTYLAIRYCVASMPPFLMAGARFLAAGGILYGLARLWGARRPTAAHWGRCAAAGSLMIAAGNGLVVWSEQRVPSSIAALMIAMTPLWFALFAWLLGGERPCSRGLLGILMGLAGVACLVGPGALAGAGPVDPSGAFALLVAAMAWAAGSLLAKGMAMPQSGLLATGMEMLTGGGASVLVGLALGERQRLVPAQFSMAAWLAFAYLVVFGSLVAFTAYGYLIRTVSAARLSTYAYVNPAIALLLGATIGGERLAPGSLLAAGIIVGGVLLMTAAAPRKSEQGLSPRQGPAAETRRTVPARGALKAGAVG